MSVLKIKDANNNWQSIPAIKGADGRDGYVQYTAGTGIDITNNVISNTQTSAEWGNITGTMSDQTDLNSALAGKADVGDIPDLTNYVKNTDYANTSKGGVIKTDSTYYGTNITNSGILYSSMKTYAQYANLLSDGFISKGTLENVLQGKNLTHAVKSMDDTVVDIKAMTQAEYDVLTPAEQSTGTYLITDPTDDSYIDELPIGSVIEYDGNTVPDGWVEVVSKPIIGVAGLSTTQTGTQSDYVKVVLDTADIMNSGMELTNDGGIKITSSEVTKALVIGKIRYAVGGACAVALRKNSSNNLGVLNLTIDNYRGIETSCIMEVTKNDVIYLYGYNNTANASFAGAITDGRPIYVNLTVLAF